MKARLGIPIGMAITLFIVAFSTGSPVFLSLAVLIVLLIFTSLISVYWASETMTISTYIGSHSTVRGAPLNVEISVKHSGLLPIAPIILESSLEDENEPIELTMTDSFKNLFTVQTVFSAEHVGVFHPGIKHVVVEDLLGMFTAVITPESTVNEVAVLPLTFELESPEFGPSQPSIGTMSRATEDLNSPADIREWQPGDPMKKIHWKLSLRRKEPIVRKFEEPILPEALIVMDYSSPPDVFRAEAGSVKDAIIETSASMLLAGKKREFTALLPLHGNHQIEIHSGMDEQLILESLARVQLTDVDCFDQTLLMATQRMKNIGALIVITARLNGNIAEALIGLRRYGPTLRLYLIIGEKEQPNWLPFIVQLQQSDIDVCYICV